MKCNNCGKVNVLDNNYCPNCGHKQEKTVYKKDFYFNPKGVNVSNSELKKRARDNLRNEYIFSVAILFVLTLLLGVPILGFILAGVVFVGMAGFLLQLSRNDKSPEIEIVAIGFRNLERNIFFGLLKTIYLFLWYLLFIIPGIIKKYSYAMSDFIAYDHPDLSAKEVIKKSELMMKGNKGKLFLLELSFIGWKILSLFTFGIGFIFLRPYIKLAYAEFYEELTRNETIIIEEPILIEE